MTARRRIAALLSASALLIAGPAALPSVAAAQDQAAVAVNTKDGSSIFKLAFSVRRVMGDVVDQQNAAVAFASCESCQTVAISIQILLVAGDPSVVDPTNIALALNQDCTLCFTLASAYQFVVGRAGIQLTGEGRQALERIHQQLSDLRKSNLAIDEIQARTDALMDQLRQVLATELVVRGQGSSDQQEPGTSSDAQAPAGESTTDTTPAAPPTTTSTTPQDQTTTPSTQPDGNASSGTSP